MKSSRGEEEGLFHSSRLCEQQLWGETMINNQSTFCKLEQPNRGKQIGHRMGCYGVLVEQGHMLLACVPDKMLRYSGPHTHKKGPLEINRCIADWFFMFS
jgi:hypothetical protein